MSNNLSDKTYTTQPTLVETDNNKWVLSEPVTTKQMYQILLTMLEQEYFRTDQLTSPQKTIQYLQVKLAKYEHEVFCCIYLDNQHHVIGFEELFRGTINAASVYPREVVKSCLMHNAQAILLVHNHPSGDCQPSSADEMLTKRLVDALALVDIRVLDHILIAGSSTISFAERGLI
jgi:DNA repair protein RadC